MQHFVRVTASQVLFVLRCLRHRNPCNMLHNNPICNENTKQRRKLLTAEKTILVAIFQSF